MHFIELQHWAGTEETCRVYRHNPSWRHKILCSVAKIHSTNLAVVTLDIILHGNVQRRPVLAGGIVWAVSSSMLREWASFCSEMMYGGSREAKESLSPDFLICYDLLMMQQSLAAFSNPLPVGCEVCQFQWHRGQGGQWEVSCPSSGVQLCQGLWGGQC